MKKMGTSKNERNGTERIGREMNIRGKKRERENIREGNRREESRRTNRRI
jgi:hypothetical protein